MKKSKADLILHPVRMKIIQLLAYGSHYTSQQLGEMLPDVPQATLYRHINLLVTAGLIQVVETNQVRGTLEKILALADNGGNLGPDGLKSASRDDHMNYFLAFLSTVIGDFGKYLEQEQIDFVEDGVGYRQAQLYMDDEEFAAFVGGLREVFATAVNNKPGAGRRLRSITTILIPEPGKPE